MPLKCSKVIVQNSGHTVKITIHYKLCLNLSIIIHLHFYISLKTCLVRTSVKTILCNNRGCSSEFGKHSDHALEFSVVQWMGNRFLNLLKMQF